MIRTCARISCSWGLRSSSCRDFLTPPGWAARVWYQRLGACQAGESALSDLEESAVQGSPWHVEVGHDLPVQAHGSLREEPPRLARRTHADAVGEQGRQVNGIAVRQRNLRNLFGRLTFSDDPREVL